MFVCIALTIVATLLTTGDFSSMTFILTVIRSYVMNQTISFMLDMDAIDEWFHSITKMKDVGLSNSLINTLIYATIINTLNTLLASRMNFIGNFFHTYPWLFVVGTIAGWFYAPYSIKISEKL